MDISLVNWLPELEMEDPTFIDQYEMNTILGQFSTQDIAAALGEDFPHSFSSESHSSYPTSTPRSNRTFCHSSMEASNTGIPWNSCTMGNFSAQDASSPSIISFGKPDSPRNCQQFYGSMVGESFKLEEELVPPGTSILRSQGSFINQSCVSNADKISTVSIAATKPPFQAQGHIIAERKRRERLSQLFIALSALVPGLKKMDKASILGDAVKYVKQLQERVKTLEEQHTMKRTCKSLVFVKKSQILDGDDQYLSSTGHSTERLPQIEARVHNENILIRIHCKKHKGILVKTLAEIEKIHLSINNTTVMPFTTSALDMTVMAQMEEDFSMTMKDLVKNLHCALSKFT